MIELGWWETRGGECALVVQFRNSDTYRWVVYRSDSRQTYCVGDDGGYSPMQSAADLIHRWDKTLPEWAEKLQKAMGLGAERETVRRLNQSVADLRAENGRMRALLTAAEQERNHWWRVARVEQSISGASNYREVDFRWQDFVLTAGIGQS